MHRIIHTFKKILQLLFNRIFYVAVALMLQLTWLLITAWRLAAYSKIYFACNQYDQHPGRTLDRKQKDQSVL